MAEEPAAPTSVLAAAEAPAIPEPAPAVPAGAAALYGDGTPAAPQAAPGEPVVEKPAEEKPAEGEKPTEEKPVEEKPTEEKPAEGDPKVPADAASYEIKLPETMKVDDALLGKFKETAFAAGLDNVKAQQFVDLYATALEGQAKLVQEANLAAFDSQQTAWKTEIEAMPEFQGEAKARTLSVIGRFMDEFGSAEAREVFEVSGAGNSPHIIRMILSAAESLTEGEPTLIGRARGATQGRKTGPEILYGEPKQG